MPLQLSVGLSKKQGLPDYGSIGASCSVTVELDGSLLHQDLEPFHRHVKSAYVACSQAVNDELARQRQNEGNGVSHKAQQSNAPAHTASGDGSTQNAPSGNGANGHRASQKQVEYINQLARQIRGLGVRRLDTLANNMFGQPLVELTSLNASALIDTLKAIKDGHVDVEAALNGAAT